MNNLLFNMKKFLANKNTVTFLGVILAVVILYIGYNYRIQEAIKPQHNVPYAKVTIQPRTRITEDMIGYTDVPPKLIMGSVVLNAGSVIGKYSNYNTIVPQGSLFFQESLTTEAELPDSALIKIPEGYTAFNLPVNIESSYGNSIFPDTYINIYFKALNEEGKVIIGELADNIKVLAVKDQSGKNVFESTSQSRVPSTIIFGVPEDLHLLLRKALYLSDVSAVRAELIPVPNTEAYTGDVGAITITNQYLKSFIELHTGYVPADQLPDANDNDNTDTDTDATPDNTTTQ